MSDSWRSPNARSWWKVRSTPTDSAYRRARREGAAPPCTARTGVPATRKSPIRGTSRSTTPCLWATRTSRATCTSRSTPACPSWATHAVTGPTSGASSPPAGTGISAATRNDSAAIRAITWLTRISRSVAFTYITNSSRLSATMTRVSTDCTSGTEVAVRGSALLS